MATRVIETGFSSCPNDTFMFHGLICRSSAGGGGSADRKSDIEVPGLRFEPWIADIEALNLRALDPSRALPVSKLSASALAQVTDRYTVLAAGAALGRGCGPLVVRRAGDERLETLADLRGRSVAIPGQHTTAHLLLRTCMAEALAAAGASASPPLEVRIMRFEQIMPAVAAGQVDAGLIIHESRFTYPEHGLVELADLGALWERSTGLPIPLGMICAARSLATADIDAIEAGLRRSVELAFAEPERSRAWIREHAQELDDEVCRKHIALYVNEFSIDLGDEGRAAIAELLARGRASGLLPSGPSCWR